MFTIEYKGWFIHGYCDRDEVRIQSPDYQMYHANSMHGAKCLITRRINKA